jgi:hypothetical protein
LEVVGVDFPVASLVVSLSSLDEQIFVVCSEKKLHPGPKRSWGQVLSSTAKVVQVVKDLMKYKFGPFV